MTEHRRVKRKEYLFKFWVLELREIFRESKNSADFLDSWTEFNSAVSFIHIFFHQESLIKLLDFRIWSIVLSRKGNRYFTIKNLVFFVVAILIYRINNQKMIERKNVYLTGLLPIPMNSIGPSNDTMDDSKDSFNINWYSKLIVPLLYRKKISDRDEDSKYHTRMNNHLFAKEIKEFLGNPTRAGRSFLYDRWLKLQLDLNPTERLFKKEEDVSFVLLRQSENKEIANIVKISIYLQNNVSIHPISSDPGCVGVAKDELYSSDSFLNKNRLFGLFHLFHDRNRAGYLLHKRFQEMANLFNLSITKPDLVYHNGFSFSIDFSRLDKKQKFINEINSWHESKQKSLLVLPPLFYEENESCYPNNTYGSIKNLSNLFHRNSEYEIKRYQIGKKILNHRKKILNHRPTRKYTINQHFSNWKRNQKDLIYQTERSMTMNKDPNAYKYKWSNGSKNFQEHLDRFISEQNRRFQVVFDPFQVVFDRLHMNAYSIDWSEVIDKNKSLYFLSKSLYFLSKSPYFFLSKFLPFLNKFLPFLSNSLPFFFVSFGNIPIHRSEIHMYELKRPNDPLGNPLLESIGLQIVHLKKRKPFLLDDFYTSKKSKLSFNEFNKRENCISFHTRKKKKKEEEKKKRWKSFSNTYFWKSFSNTYFWKSFSNTYFYFWKSFSTSNFGKSFSFSNTYFSMILDDHYQDQDNWLNLFPVKEFHRSSLISSFYKADLLKFFDHLDNPYLDNQYLERSCNYDFTYFMYGQFLDLYLLKKPKKREPEPMLIEFQYMRLEDLNLGSKMDLIANLKVDLIDNPERIHSGGLVKNWKEEYWRKKSEKKKKHRPCLTKYSEKYVPSKKRKKHRPCLPKRFEKRPMYRQRNSVFSTLSKLKQFQPYIIQLLFTRTGHEYLNLIFSDTFLDLLAILRRSPKFQQFVSIFDDISDGSKRILREKLCLSPRNPISEISSKCLHHFLVSVCLENESPLISTDLIEFFVLIVILLLVTGYLVHTHLVFVSRFSNELQREFEEVKSLMIPSYMIELEKLMDRYPISEQNSFGLKDMFVVALEQLGNFLEERRGSASAGNMPRGGGPAYGVKSIRSKKKDLNLIDLIRIIPNPINRIEFLRNTRHLSPTSKAIYTLIRKRKDVNSDWIDDKIESWILNSDFIADKEREFMVQFSTLTTEKRIDQILLSLTNSYHLSKNNSGYQMIEQPGTIYLRNLIDIHKKYLLNYEFNTSCLAERRIFLAHYQTITYSETPCATTSLDFPSHGKPFSLRLALSPPRGILVIGSIGTGRSYLVKYLATNSYVPFITVSVNKFLDNYPKGFDINDLFDDDDDDLFDDREGTIYSLLPSYEDNCYNLDRYDPDYLDRNYDSHLEFLSMQDPIPEDIIPEIDRFFLKLQFELAKAMSPCIIWIPNIHDLDGNESNDLSLGVLVNSLSMDSEKSSTRNILVIASTHTPQKVDPALIAPNKLNTFIKIRRLLIPQQRKHFFSLSHTRGFHLEKKMFDTNGCGSITLGSNVRDLVALTNEALSISIIQKKLIIDTNIIRHALHRQTWDFRSQIRSVQDHGILFYQIGRAVSQNLLLSNFSIDPISIYMKKKSCNGGDSDLYKWYLELGTSMKKLTILLYLLSCSAGSVAQNLWSLTGPNEKNDGLTSYRLLYNDSDLVHGLLEVEGALLGSSQTGSPFDNDGVTFLLRPEPRNPINMIQNGSRSILDHRFLYEKYESGFEEGEGVLDPLEEDLFNHIVWAPRIWRPWEFLFDDCMSNEFGFPYWERSFWDKQIIYDEEGELKENDSEFLQDGTMEYQTQNRSFKEQGVFRISQFIWEPSDPLFLLFQDDPFVSVFSHRELVADEEMPNVLLTCQTKKIYWKYLNRRWFRKNMPEQNFELLIDRQRQFRTKSSLSNGLFRSNTLSESYQYLSNLFLSNGTLLAQITKTLLRKRWLFPEEMVVTICSNNEIK
nr:Ycf2 protein [Medicago lupulina]